MKNAEDIPGEGEMLEGKYANHFKVGHNAVEFLIDCGQLYPDSEEAHFHTRIITSAIYAKALLEVLRESIARYEEKFGEIREEADTGSWRR